MQFANNLICHQWDNLRRKQNGLIESAIMPKIEIEKKIFENAFYQKKENISWF